MNDIFRQLGAQDGFPIEAIRAADANRDQMVPVFLDAFERCTSATPAEQDALFLAFHLLGQWREKAAYRPLAVFLRRPSKEVGPILGDSVTATAHRVMANLFDGDPQPLYDVIQDPRADEFIRSRMFATLMMVTRRGELPGEEAARFLRACDTQLKPRDGCFVWCGWQEAIGMLGLIELAPMARRAFQDDRIDPSWTTIEYFEQDLQSANEGKPPEGARDEYEPFGDTIEELKDWQCFQPKPERHKSDRAMRSTWPDGTIRNPLRNVGRNDPCPCGSGKKFKKCCIDKPEEELLAMLGAADELDTDEDQAIFGDAEYESFGETTYDPLNAPDPDEWRALGEQERIDAVRAFHVREGIETPNDVLHATIHAVVETQIADGDDLPVRETLNRLMGEGLDRHDAIHAIGSELAAHIYDLLHGQDSAGTAGKEAQNDAYFAALRRLTAKRWLKSA